MSSAIRARCTSVKRVTDAFDEAPDTHATCVSAPVGARWGCQVGESGGLPCGGRWGNPPGLEEGGREWVTAGESRGKGRQKKAAHPRGGCAALLRVEAVRQAGNLLLLEPTVEPFFHPLRQLALGAR